jgi:hypothetical protein
LTHKAFAFDKIEAQLGHNIILIAQDICDLAGDPSALRIVVSLLKPKWESCHTNFFMTSTLTFCMSTLRLNSGGNFVDFNNFASTLVAMLQVVVSFRIPLSNGRD